MLEIYFVLPRAELICVGLHGFKVLSHRTIPAHVTSRALEDFQVNLVVNQKLGLRLETPLDQQTYIFL